MSLDEAGHGAARSGAGQQAGLDLDDVAFPVGRGSSAHLAAYAGIAPVTRSSGFSIKGEHPARTGNRKLKRAGR